MLWRSCLTKSISNSFRTAQYFKMSTITIPLSPSKVQVTTSTKRALSPSSSTPSKIQKVEKIEVGTIEEEVDFDADALLEATIAAEEEVKSQPSSSQAKPSSSNSKVTGSEPSLFSIKKGAQAAIPKAPPSTLTHGDEALEAETMDKEWYDRLKGELQKPYFKSLKAFLKAETNAKKIIYPPAHLVHSWSRLTPLSTVKVVVVGQDPYHGPNQACGHSFSVQKGVRVPPSLLNMYKELGNEYGSAFKNPGHG